MKKTLFLVLAVLFFSCDHGLAPLPPVEPGFGGTIFFAKESWPPADSLVNLWVFASQIFPLDSEKVFLGLFSNPPKIYLYPAFEKNLPLFGDSVSYSFGLPPGSYYYVGVLQRTANDLSIKSLRVVGVHATSDVPPVPITVVVTDENFVPGIDIRVNFRKPPPQPF